MRFQVDSVSQYVRIDPFEELRWLDYGQRLSAQKRNPLCSASGPQSKVEFGHKVFLTAGKSGLILDCKVAEGNPCDSQLFLPLIERQAKIYGRPPRQTSADGGFASRNNIETAKSQGVKDVCFSKRCGLAKEDMAKSVWVFEKLRNFRAGIEGVISTLKRAFGCFRANW